VVLLGGVLPTQRLAFAAETAAPRGVFQEPAQVIVKFKTKLTGPLQARASVGAVSARAGLALRGQALIEERTQVITATGLSSQALATRLAQDPEVLYAEPDQKRYAHTAPSDPRYGNGLAGGGPTAGQWYLRAPNLTTVAAINAEEAWNLTQGSPSIVVAVLDSGIRYDHADLMPVSAGGNILPGYDMINDSLVANDGDGRDADASDPGDWLSAADVSANGRFNSCDDAPTLSSWHGTQTAGLIGALTNNGQGMASVARTVHILPVRVLGKCGGRDSDIVAGMRWAAGLHIDGVPDNPHPARVINLSLGAGGSCSRVYIDAIREVNALGAAVVISAGNTAGHAVSSPANCPGVIAVAGLQHTGAKVGFSDLGPEVSLSAPAGNCVNSNQNGACLYPILTTTNPGQQAPIAGGSSYTDSYNYSIGTSFAAPLVSGTAALMLSARPGLTPLQLKLLLQSSARSFPRVGAVADEGMGSVPECTQPTYDQTMSPLLQLQCYCSTGTCGAGMLNSYAAVLSAVQATDIRPHARIDIKPTRPAIGLPVELTAQNSEADAGRTLVAYQWRLVDGGGIVKSINTPQTRDISVVPTGIGTFVVNLEVRDSTGDNTDVEMAVVVGSPADAPESAAGSGAGTDGSGGGAAGGAWLLGLFVGTLALLILPRARPNSA
jgi:serine protease